MFTSYVMTYVASNGTAEASYLHDLGIRLFSNPTRFGASLLTAFIPIVVAIFTRETKVKVLSIFSILGAFWWGWWLYNSFAKPPHPVDLIGSRSFINQPSDLSHGWGLILFVFALVVAAIAYRIGRGFGGLLAAFSVFTGVIILVNLLRNLGII